MKKSDKDMKPDNFHMFFEKVINIENRTIHLFEEINADVTSEIMRGMQLMVSKNLEPISLYLNTFGGCPYSSFALYDFIKSLEDVLVKTFVTGCAMSGGSIIFLAGDERYMYENSVLMLHTVSSFSEGKQFEMQDESDECKQIFKQMCIIYGNHSNLSAKSWSNKVKYRNIYIRATEAVRLNLVTRVI